MITHIQSAKARYPLSRNLVWALTNFILCFSVTTSLGAQPQYFSKYAGQEHRQIKSLSSDDIEQLNTGKGWGLAKAAELNGMPGPIHLLQMKDKIHLSDTQTKQIQALYDEMLMQAIPLGKRLVSLEGNLNRAFATQSINEAMLQAQLQQIADTQKQLRFVHLAAHLKTPQILSKQQIEKYNQLRGYHQADPCQQVPSGHDAAMWKKHNNCK